MRSGVGAICLGWRREWRFFFLFAVGLDEVEEDEEALVCAQTSRGGAHTAPASATHAMMVNRLIDVIWFDARARISDAC